MAFETSLTVGVDTKKAVSEMRRFDSSLKRTAANSNVQTKKIEGSFTRLQKRMATVLSGAVLIGFFVKAARSSLDFGTAMAEVSTLLEGTEAQMKGISDAALEMSVTFGSLPTDQANAFYQVISAGAGTAKKQIEIMTAANKLAVGGVTDITTAADGLTSVLNAYGDKVSSASDVTDTMFTAMKAGKTTIGELSSSLGLVAPLAVTAGVSFGELNAAVAALTKGGINTRIAVAGVRGVLAAIIKPTSEAEKMAEELGLEFNVAALEAKRLSGFLTDLIEKTGGSIEKMAQLFGGLEALVPILALTGASAKDFADIMEQMEGRVGATDEAFAKIASSIPFRVKVLQSQFMKFITVVGTGFTKRLVPALELVRDNIGFIKNAMVGLVAVMGVSAVINASIAFLKFAKALTWARAASIAFSIAQNAGKAGLVLIAVVVAQVTGAFDKLVEAFDLAREKAEELAGPGLSKVKEVLESIGLDFTAIDAAISDATTSLDGMGDVAKNTVTPLTQLSDSVATVTDELKDFADTIKSDIKTPLENYNDQLENIKKAQDAKLLSDVESAKGTQMATEALIAADPVLSRVEGGLHSFSDSLIDGALQGKSFADTMKSTFRSLATDILKELNRVIISKAFSSLIGGSLGSLFGGSLGSSSTGGGGGGGGGRVYQNALGPVGEFADGGLHSGGLRIVGENGPELEATGPSRIFNAQQTKNMMAGGGGGGTVINIDARGSNGDQAVMDAVEAGIRRAAPNLINASVNRVKDERSRDPDFFGRGAVA